MEARITIAEGVVMHAAQFADSWIAFVVVDKEKCFRPVDEQTARRNFPHLYEGLRYEDCCDILRDSGVLSVYNAKIYDGQRDVE